MRHSGAAAVYACVGDSAEARLAADTAARLEELRVAERASLAAGAGAARRRRTVVALDGCGDGCASRILRSWNVRPSLTVRLDELAAEDDDAVVAYLLSLLRPRSGALERYLRALLELGADGARAAAVARAVGVSAVTALEGLRRLVDTGLAERGADGRFALTDAGLRAARDGATNRETAERFLVEYLGYGEADAREQAPALAAALPPDVAARLAERLGG